MPVFSFGENEVFDQVENPRGTWLRWIQERLQGIMGISLPLFHARGVFQYSFGLIPYRKPIHTIGEWTYFLNPILSLILVFLSLCLYIDQGVSFTHLID